MINYWNSNSIPYSWYQKNYETDWCGSDNLASSDPNWNISFTYKFNAQGFRTHDLNQFSNQKVNVALGCSHTMGIGLPINMTWPFFIEGITKITTLNLGLGQGSTDTVSRILTNICGLFDIQNVYILWPSYNRFESYHKYGIKSIIPHSSNLEHTWFLEECNSIQRFYKNQNIVYNLQKLHNFKLKEMNMESKWTIPGDLARDQLHNGPQSNLNLANMFLTM